MTLELINKTLYLLNIFLIAIWILKSKMSGFVAKRTIPHLACITCKSKLGYVGKPIDLFVDEQSNLKADFLEVFMKVIIMKALSWFVNTLFSDYIKDKCEDIITAPNDTAYKRWSCHGGFKLLCKLCRNLPPDLPFLEQAGHVDPLDGWRCSS